MTRRRFGLPAGLIWWAIPLADLLVTRLVVEEATRGAMSPAVGLILIATAPMANVLAVAAIWRIRRGPTRGLAGFVIGGLVGIATFAAMVVIAPDWAAWRVIAAHRAMLWMRSDPDLAAQAILDPLLKLLGPQVAPALIGLAIDRFRRRRPAVEGADTETIGVRDGGGPPMIRPRVSIAGLMILAAIVAVDCGSVRWLWVEVAGQNRGNGSLILGLVGSLPMLNALAVVVVLRRCGLIAARPAVGFLIGGGAAMLAYNALVVVTPLPLGWILRPLNPFLLRPPLEPLKLAFNVSLGAAYLMAPQFLLATLASRFHRRYRLRVFIERREPVVDADRPPAVVREGLELPVRG